MGGKKPINHDPSRGNCRSRRGRHDIITHHPHHNDEDYNKKLIANEYSLFSSAWMFGLNSTNINDHENDKSNDHDNNHDNDTNGTLDSSPNTDDEIDDHDNSKYSVQPQYQQPFHPQFQHLHPRFTYRPVQQQLQPILIKQPLPQQQQQRQQPQLFSTTLFREYEHKMIEKDHQFQALTSKLDTVSETVKILECKIETILSNLNKNISSSSSTSSSQAQKEKDQRNRSLSLSPMAPLSPSVSCNYLALSKQQSQQLPASPSSPTSSSSSSTLPPSLSLLGIAESAVNQNTSSDNIMTTVIPANNPPVSNNNSTVPVSKLQERLSTLEGRQAMMQSKVSQLDYAFRGTNSASWKKACEILQTLLDKSIGNAELQTSNGSMTVTEKKCLKLNGNENQSKGDGNEMKKNNITRENDGICEEGVVAVAVAVVESEDIKSCIPHEINCSSAQSIHVGKDMTSSTKINIDIAELTENEIMTPNSGSNRYDEKDSYHETIINSNDCNHHDDVVNIPLTIKTKKNKKKSIKNTKEISECSKTSSSSSSIVDAMKKNNNTIPSNKNKKHIPTEALFYATNVGITNNELYQTLAQQPQQPQQQPMMMMCPTTFAYQPMPITMNLNNMSSMLMEPMSNVPMYTNTPPTSYNMYEITPSSSHSLQPPIQQISYPCEYDYNYEYEYDYDYVTGTPGVINGMAPSMSMPYVSDQQAAALVDYQAAFAYNLQQEQHRQQYMYQQQQQQVQQQQQQQAMQQQMKYTPPTQPSSTSCTQESTVKVCSEHSVNVNNI